MSLPIHRTKAAVIEQITEAFKEYEKYKKSKLDKYKRGKQLGEKGKEASALARHLQLRDPVVAGSGIAGVGEKTTL